MKEITREDFKIFLTGFGVWGLWDEYEKLSKEYNKILGTHLDEEEFVSKSSDIYDRMCECKGLIRTIVEPPTIQIDFEEEFYSGYMPKNGFIYKTEFFFQEHVIINTGTRFKNLDRLTQYIKDYKKIEQDWNGFPILG